MFVKNNEWIDFSELERRVTLEISKLARVARARPEQGPSWKTASLFNTGTAALAMTGETQMPDEPARRSAWRALSHLMWGILHLPTVVRRAISGFYAAEYARSGVEHLYQVTEAIQTRLAGTETAMAALTGQVANISASLDELDGRLRVFSTATSGHAARIEEMAAQSSRLIEQLAMVKREVMFQQRQLARLASAPVADQPQEAVAAVLTQRYDSLYAAFEDVFRGSREAMMERLTPYVERLVLAGAGRPDKPIVDIGCGRGEWLELLGREGLSAYGIDINTIMVERSVAFGLDARHADVMSHMRGLEDASRSAVTAFHILEHLPFETLVEFLDEALRVLAPGGTLIVETPNPETMKVGATTFYYDPTHRNPLMPPSLQFIIEHRGFTDVEVLKLHPFVQALLEGTSENVRLLNHVLFGPQDFAIIARRV